MVRESILAGALWKKEQSCTSWWLESKERKRKGQGFQYLLQVHTTNDLTSFH
jgi:hypothetical protein